MFFLFFPEKTGIDVTYKLSPMDKDNLLEMSNPVFLKTKIEKKTKNKKTTKKQKNKNNNKKKKNKQFVVRWMVSLRPAIWSLLQTKK